MTSPTAHTMLWCKEPAHVDRSTAYLSSSVDFDCIFWLYNPTCNYILDIVLVIMPKQCISYFLTLGDIFRFIL